MEQQRGAGGASMATQSSCSPHPCTSCLLCFCCAFCCLLNCYLVPDIFRVRNRIFLPLSNIFAFLRTLVWYDMIRVVLTLLSAGGHRPLSFTGVHDINSIGTPQHAIEVSVYHMQHAAWHDEFRRKDFEPTAEEYLVFHIFLMPVV